MPASARFLADTRAWRRRVALLLAVSSLLTSGARAAEKREPQRYYAPAPSRVEPTLMWVPRVIAFPFWLVSEYAIRKPIGALVTEAEADDWPDAIHDFFTFGSRDQVTIIPSVLFDFGLKPSVGFNLSWRYFLADPNTLNLHFGTWGPDWVTVSARDEYSFGRSTAFVEGKLVRRKDSPFYGMGPESPNHPTYRFQSMTSEVSVGYGRRLPRLSTLRAQVGLRTLGFGDESCCGDQSVQSAVDQGTLAAPPGFGADYTAEFQSLSVALDSRGSEPGQGTGARLEGHVEGDFAPSRDASRRRAWLRYGGATGVALDVHRGRVVGVGVAADFADGLVGTVPFVDQVVLGGNGPMRGFLQYRLIDRSSFVTSAEYRWPVWVYLNGVMRVDVGNVFGARLENFAAGLLRLSASLGLRSTGDPDSGFELLLAGGTDPFDGGFRFSSFRLVIGSHHGF